MKHFKSIAAVLFCLCMLSACNDPADNEPLQDDPVGDETAISEGLTNNNQMAETINATIIDSPNLSSFAELLQETDLADMLGETKGGPYTVFAPTDAAFNALQPVTVDWLLMDENMDRLTDLLGYHIVDDVFNADDIADGGELFGTYYGAGLEIIVGDAGTWKVNGIEVVKKCKLLMVRYMLLMKCLYPMTGLIPTYGIPLIIR